MAELIAVLERRLAVVRAALERVGARNVELQAKLAANLNEGAPLLREQEQILNLLELHGARGEESLLILDDGTGGVMPLQPKPSVATAILGELRQSSGGKVAESEIVDKVVGRIERGEIDTSTKEPRKMVLSTLGYLHKSQKVRRGPSGYVELIEHGALIPM